MSIPINNGASLDKAIVEKVASVLANSKHKQSIYISIQGEVGEIPTIDYRIKELIVLENEVEE